MKFVTHIDTLIVGAGISGLATAVSLGRKANYRILERDSEMGGYCKTVKKQGFVWDYSGHFFHFKHPDIEAWLKARMPGQTIRTVNKLSFVDLKDQSTQQYVSVDFPFQKNIHQLPKAEFIDCLYDLYFAHQDNTKPPPTNFKDMLSQRFGRAIAERFLIPYNEKLYATDLATLDVDAMGRFFPHADLSDIVRNMKVANNETYNAHFTYPQGGAIEYVKALASDVNPEAISLGESLLSVDLKSKTAVTNLGTYTFQNLVTSAPFPSLLKICDIEFDESMYSWNQVLVFNLGFDSKGPKARHWVYYPDRDVPFYRIGFYDNIFESNKMSLYVEMGFSKDAVVDVAAARTSVLQGLREVGVVTTHQLVAEHSVVMNPAYVHLTSTSIREVARLKAELVQHGVHSLGRYGGWTYCAIEDNIVEARQLTERLKLNREWPWS
jgi:protoporphyrinogen oxidase